MVFERWAGGGSCVMADGTTASEVEPAETGLVDFPNTHPHPRTVAFLTPRSTLNPKHHNEWRP